MKMADKEIGESLKQISANLETISKTLKELKHEEKATTYAEDWKKRIENLINRVNYECKKRMFTPKKELAIAVIIIFYVGAFLVLIVELVAVLGAIGSYAQTLHTLEEQLKFLVEQLSPYSALSVSIIVTELTLVPVVLAFPRTTSEELTDWYYDKLSKDVDAKDKPYLKALINMKCNEFDLSLWENYQNCIRLNCDLFTEESLLRNLLTQ
jgi:preprotein translocase subunit SecE